MELNRTVHICMLLGGFTAKNAAHRSGIKGMNDQDYHNFSVPIHRSN